MQRLQARIAHILIASLVLLVLGPTPIRRNLISSIEKAKTTASSGDLEAALAYIDQAISIDPGLVNLNLIAAEAALSTDFPERTISYLSALPDTEQYQETTLCLTAELRAALGQISQAFTLWKEAQEHCLRRPQFLRNFSAQLINLEKFSMAEAVLEQLSSLEPADADIQFQLGALIAIRDPEKALVQLRIARQLSEKNQPLLADLIKTIENTRIRELKQYSLSSVGQVFASNSEWSFAAKAFRNAVEIQPNYSDALSFLGLALDELGYDGLRWLNQAVRAEPSQALPHIHLALHWLRNGSPELALSELEKASILDPDNPIIPAQIAQTYEYLGEIGSAIQAYRAATELAPQDPNMWMLLAQASARNEFDIFNIGLPAARNAVTLAPNNAAAYDTLGYSYYLLDDYDFAERFLTRALAIDPASASTRYYLGLLFAAKLEFEASITSFEMAVILDAGGSVGRLAQLAIETLR